MRNIKLTVKMKPNYTAKKLNAIDKIVTKEKPKAKSLKPGKKFSSYIKKVTNLFLILICAHLSLLICANLC